MGRQKKAKTDLRLLLLVDNAHPIVCLPFWLCLLTIVTFPRPIICRTYTLEFLDDCIGLAVDLWSEVTISRSDTFEITAEGDGATQMPKDESNYLVVGVKAAFDIAQKPMPVLKYHVISRIPYARGLGSSSAAIVAGIIAGLVLAGHRLPCWGSEALLQVAAGIEVRSFWPVAKNLIVALSTEGWFGMCCVCLLWFSSREQQT